MTTNRPQNSILVLATLGVYLGLVLAGATPQILAQAATTRLFDVKDEIEVKDDLDKKPDPKFGDLSRALNEHFDDLEVFFDDLRKLHSIGKFDPNSDRILLDHVHYVPCPYKRVESLVDSDAHFDPWLSGPIDQLKTSTDNFSRFTDCLQYLGTEKNNTARSVGLWIEFDDSDFIVKVSPRFDSPLSSASFFERLSSDLKQFQTNDHSVRIRVLLDHTVLSRADNQVIITTRLPRAGLDALLATSAK